MTRLRASSSLTAAIVVAVGVWLSGQTSQVFQFVVSVTNVDGMPVSDLGSEDIVMSEDGVHGRRSPE